MNLFDLFAWLLTKALIARAEDFYLIKPNDARLSTNSKTSYHLSTST